MELNKKLKVYNAIQNALSATIVTAGILAGTGLLGGVTNGIMCANKDFEFDKKLRVIEKSSEYQKHATAVIDDAYSRFKSGDISYAEFLDISNSTSSLSSIKEYAENSPEYADIVDEYESKRNESEELGFYAFSGMAVASGVGFAGIVADKVVTNKIQNTKMQIEYKSKQEEKEENSL